MTRAKSRSAPPGTKKTRRRAKALHAQGYCLTEIAAKANLHPRAVRRLLKYQNLKQRITRKVA